MLFVQDDERGSINERYEIRRVQNTRERMEILTDMSALAHPRSERTIQIIEELGLTYFVKRCSSLSGEVERLQ